MPAMLRETSRVTRKLTVSVPRTGSPWMVEAQPRWPRPRILLNDADGDPWFGRVFVIAVVGGTVSIHGLPSVVFRRERSVSCCRQDCNNPRTPVRGFSEREMSKVQPQTDGLRDRYIIGLMRRRMSATNECG